jgi:hypothetical protein
MKDIEQSVWLTFCKKKYDANDKCPQCGGELSDSVQDDEVQRKCMSLCGDTYYQRFSSPSSEGRGERICS